MTYCYFVSDLHGQLDRYTKFFQRLLKEPPQAVFIGGDILPMGAGTSLGGGPVERDFIHDFLIKEFEGIKTTLDDKYPQTFLILGNDDSRFQEPVFLDDSLQGIWDYIHNRSCHLKDYQIFGYSYVPPTPFLLKDWERYDISRFVDPGSISPESGHRSIPVAASKIRYGTIAQDLARLAGDQDLEKAVFLFHAPPYMTNLDRAALDGKMVDHVPLDLHVGSIAIQRFIKSRQPLLSLHGHIHESARLTGKWQDKIGETFCFSAAHDGPELALVKFHLEDLENAERELI